MKLSIKEKAGIVDVSRIYKGVHLSEDFIRNSVISPDSIEAELKAESNRHFGICEKCRKHKDSLLPFNQAK